MNEVDITRECMERIKNLTDWLLERPNESELNIAVAEIVRKAQSFERQRVIGIVRAMEYEDGDYLKSRTEKLIEAITGEATLVQEEDI